MSDLRTFLAQVEKARPRDFLRVTRTVSPRHETAAIVAKLEDHHRSPIVFFEDVAGASMPMVSNVAGSQGRMALALGVPLSGLSARWAEAATNPIAPEETEPAWAPLDRDLSWLPPVVYHEHDADQPYLTGSIVVARDPETQKQNLSFHRMMIAGPERTGIFVEKGKHLDGILEKHRAAGEKMPVAVFLGWHPAWALGALYSGSADVDEYEIIGGLLGAPLAVTRTAAGLQVPAHAEIVLEGTVDPSVTIEEGPFGEFTGYGTGRTRTPVFELARLSARPDPIFQDVVSGHMEHLILPMLAIEWRTLQDARRACPSVSRVALIAPLTAVVALDKQSDDEPSRIIDAVLDGDVYAKQVIVVDAEIDPGDFRQVVSAMALTVQADTDVIIKTGARGTPLDPSCPNADGTSAKLGIDATRSLTRRRAITRNSFPKDVWDRIDVKALLKR